MTKANIISTPRDNISGIVYKAYVGFLNKVTALGLSSNKRSCFSITTSENLYLVEMKQGSGTFSIDSAQDEQGDVYRATFGMVIPGESNLKSDALEAMRREETYWLLQMADGTFRLIIDSDLEKGCLINTNEMLGGQGADRGYTLSCRFSSKNPFPVYTGTITLQV